MLIASSVQSYLKNNFYRLVFQKHHKTVLSAYIKYAGEGRELVYNRDATSPSNNQPEGASPEIVTCFHDNQVFLNPCYTNKHIQLSWHSAFGKITVLKVYDDKRARYLMPKQITVE